MMRRGFRLCGPVLAGLVTLTAFAGLSRVDPSSSTATPSGSTLLSATATAPLLQLSPCGGSDDQGQTSDGPQAGGGARASFRIAPSAVAEVDGNGVIVAVATNTGCVPQAGNQFYVQEPDGTYGWATPSQVDQLLAASYSGDWTTPGRYHPFS